MLRSVGSRSSVPVSTISEEDPVRGSVQDPAPDDAAALDPDHGGASFFARLVHELSSARSEDVTLERVVARCLEVVPAADCAGLTLRRGRQRLETMGATDDRAERADEAQYEVGEGPCLDSALHRGSHVVEDTLTDPRWPRWGARAAEIGVRSVISVELPALPVDGQAAPAPIGAINLYARTPRAFSGEDLDLAEVYAAHAAVALDSARLVDGLQRAVRSRHLIGMAQGMLMQRYGLGMDQAFAVLQRWSSHRNEPLREVAEGIVSGREALPEA